MDVWCFETIVLGFWKQKGSKIDLNMMRYIHGKEWDSKLIETIRPERMKPHRKKNCPNIWIGGIVVSTCTEHLKVLNTWMKSNKDKRDCRNLPGNISAKHYRRCFMLNKNRTLTPVGETETATIFREVMQQH